LAFLHKQVLRPSCWDLDKTSYEIQAWEGDERESLKAHAGDTSCLFSTYFLNSQVFVSVPWLLEFKNQTRSENLRDHEPTCALFEGAVRYFPLHNFSVICSQHSALEWRAEGPLGEIQQNPLPRFLKSLHRCTYRSKKVSSATTLSVETCPLTANLNFHSFRLKTLPLALSPSTLHASLRFAMLSALQHEATVTWGTLDSVSYKASSWAVEGQSKNKVWSKALAFLPLFNAFRVPKTSSDKTMLPAISKIKAIFKTTPGFSSCAHCSSSLSEGKTVWSLAGLKKEKKLLRYISPEKLRQRHIQGYWAGLKLPLCFPPSPFNKLHCFKLLYVHEARLTQRQPRQ